MSVYALDHVALATRDWASPGKVLRRFFGAQWLHGARTPTFLPAQLEFGNLMRVELLVPTNDPNGFVARFLDGSGGSTRPHHVTFKTSSIAETLGRAADTGFEPIMVNTANDFWKEAFFHPRATGLGFLVQIAESGVEIADLLARYPQAFAPRPDWADEPAPAPVSLVALVGRVRDAGLADELFCRVLDGTMTTQADHREYSWPHGASLRLYPAGADDPPGLHTMVVRAAPAVPSGPPGTGSIGYDGRPGGFVEEIGMTVIRN